MQAENVSPGPFSIEAERLNRGLTAKACAAEIGVPDYVLRYAESGGRPRPAAAKKIADWFGVKVTTIWPVEPDEVAA